MKAASRDCVKEGNNGKTVTGSECNGFVIMETSRKVQLGYLEVTVQEKLRSGWPGPFVKVEGCCG
jgi:hypothetical protein